ncbi:unnamed protein product [Angiostrongylus costaricensis]|uniref:Velvet domain-containing protein n=1 Tax=Angiostrongylus costaricensis TaxID=334426 RepID=A0A0R3PH10_ANGCS|nr:unnamed protein product [Angiostrongylus costaricensis]
MAKPTSGLQETIMAKPAKLRKMEIVLGPEQPDEDGPFKYQPVITHFTVLAGDNTLKLHSKLDAATMPPSTCTFSSLSAKSVQTMPYSLLLIYHFLCCIYNEDVLWIYLILECPCEAFNENQCTHKRRSLSHVPLENYTRIRSEGVCRAEEKYTYQEPVQKKCWRAFSPQCRTCPQQATVIPTSDATIRAAAQLQPANEGQLAPQCVAVPTIGDAVRSTPTSSAISARRPWNATAVTCSPCHRDDATTISQTRATLAVTNATNAAPYAPFNFSEILALLEDESPATTPIHSGLDDNILGRQSRRSNVVTWRLIAMDRKPAYSDIDFSLVLTSIDPRLNRLGLVIKK